MWGAIQNDAGVILIVAHSFGLCIPNVPFGITPDTNVLKNKEFIKNKEHYLINTKQIIKVINNCDSRIKTICCGYCLKCKKINTITTHKCKYYS